MRKNTFAILFVSLLLAAALQSLRYKVLLDDAYITFRAARNFAHGEGLVFNPGEKVLSTTAPGYALLLGGLTYLGFETVLSARWVCCIALMVAGLSLLKLASGKGRPEIGFTAGFILCFFPELVRAWGNECMLLIALFAVGWLLYEQNKPVLCAVTFTAGAIVRPDFAIPCLLFATAWVRKGRKEFWRYTVAGVFISIVWLLLFAHFFGSPIPHTLTVKRAQGLLIAMGDPRAFEGWHGFGQGFRWLLRRLLFDPSSGIFFIFGGLLLLQRGDWIFPVAWAIPHLFIYYLLKVPGHYFWYYYPAWLALPIAAGLAVSCVKDIAQAPGSPIIRRQSLELSVILGLSVFIAMNAYGLARDEWAEEKYRVYGQIAQMINDHVKPDESVMMNEIGQIGYLSDRRVVDVAGLIHVAPAADTFGDFAKVVQHFRPDYIVNEGWLDYVEPSYPERASAGSIEFQIHLATGEIITYRQVDTVKGSRRFLPIILKRLS